MGELVPKLKVEILMQNLSGEQARSSVGLLLQHL